MELFNLGLSDGTGHFITLTQQPTYGYVRIIGVNSK